MKRTIVTADALNTQKEIVNQAIQSGADYVLPVKENHPTLLEEVQLLFEETKSNHFKGSDSWTLED